MNTIEIFTSQVNEPIITIAIPTYKRSSLLVEAINSAINQQTTISYDIIVVDNNPERNDETELLMENFRNNRLISYYKNSSNLGMVGNWNQLFKLSKGQWVTMLHDDDLLFPNYIEVIYRKMLNINNPNIIFPGYHTTNNRQILKKEINHCNEFAYKITLNSFILGNIIGPPIGMLVRRDFFMKNLLFKDDFYPSIDWDFYLEASKIGGLYKIPEILCLYYVGVNESLKDETIVSFYGNARDLYKKTTRLLNFPYNLLNILCYRNLIVNTIRWTSSISNIETIIRAIDKIQYKRNKMLEFLSMKIAGIFSLVNNHCSVIKFK